MFSSDAVIVIDPGYAYIKMANKNGDLSILRNAYISSSVFDTSIPLSSTTRKVTLRVDEETVGSMDETRLFGTGVSQITHKGSTTSLKYSEIRFNLAAVLTEKEHKKTLTVVCIHNEEKDFKRLEKDLLGSYEIINNGVPISASVKRVIFQKEGLGTFFYLVHNKVISPTADVRILDLGLGLANDLIVSSLGEIKLYKTTQDLTVLTAARDIANSSVYQANCPEGPVNLASIADALEKDIPLGRMSIDDWNKIKRSAMLKYFKRIQQHLAASVQGAYVNSYVLTGGGSELLKNTLPKITEAFIIPDRGGIASLLGTLNMPAVKDL